MQTNTDPVLNSAATAESSSLRTPTQQSTQPTATAAPLADSMPPTLRPDLLAVADTLATRIHDCRINALDWLLGEAVAVQECRDQLPTDDFYKVLRSGRVPIGVRTAQAMVRLARNKTIRDRDRTHQLPGSTTILCTLAGLPAAVLAHALDEGTINPKTTLKQAQQFVQQWQCHSSSMVAKTT